MRTVVPLITLILGLMILDGAQSQMDPEDPLIDPSMMMEANSYRFQPPQTQFRSMPGDFRSAGPPQKLGTVMAVSQPAGIGAGGGRPVYIQSESQIPDQGQPQKEASQPIVLVVPPAAMAKAQAADAGKVSRTKREECNLEPDPGQCRRELIRYYFNPKTMSCEIFYWGGCEGNQNRFTSIKACYDICSKHDSWVKRPRVLSAKKIIRVTR